MSLKSTGQKVYDLLADSTLTQSVLTLSLLGVYCALLLQGQDVPESLLTMLQIVIGFFFGGKYQQLLHKGMS